MNLSKNKIKGKEISCVPVYGDIHVQINITGKLNDKYVNYTYLLM